jgi:hypothetical protein
MFVGHLGAGLAIKRMAPEWNLGLLFAAACFADLLLWMLVVLGVESPGPAGSSGAARFLTFVFPYSHGLLASLCWSALAAAAAWAATSASDVHRIRLAGALALAVFSHFLLDLLVHVPDLPLAGSDSPMLGFGLWRQMPVALAVELGFSAAALWLYLGSCQLSRWRRYLVAGMLLLAAILTAIGPYLPGDPPPPAVLALSSFVTLAIFVAAGFLAEGRLALRLRG